MQLPFHIFAYALLGNVKKLSIQDAFEKCKIAAEKKGFKIFGIRVSTKDLLNLTYHSQDYLISFHEQVCETSDSVERNTRLHKHNQNCSTPL